MTAATPADPPGVAVTGQGGDHRPSLRDAVRGVPGLVVRGYRWLVAFVVARWRRSLQTRVAVTTLVVSGTVVVLLGVVLMEQITTGLLDARTRSALGELDFGLSKVSSQFAAGDRNDVAGVDSTVDAVINDLANRGGPTELYDVALLTSAPGLSGRVTGDVDESSIPAAMRDAVSTQGREVWAYTTIRYRDGRREPGLVAGAPVHSPDVSYQLYYLFPLRAERQTISLVQRTVLITGALLVLLLVAIAALVTRQVVRPVRSAASTAERLASGRLEERMTVRGEDDLARLATSFNGMAERLQAHISRLEELSRVQRRFVADVSHELRTPLTTIRMAADLMHESRADFDPTVARSAELLHAQLDRFESLLADLLEISRHDAGVVVLEAEPSDLCAIVERVVTDAEPLASRRGSELRLQVPDEPVIAEVDPRRVARILRNLVSNAIEHGEGKPIDVALAAGRTSVAVCVADQGVGLAHDEAQRVFDRFWRADPARSRSTGGTGLGLSIALQDTRLHGGWLEATGKPGRGAVFRLTLPRQAGEELTASPLPLQPPRRRPALARVPRSRT